MFESIKCFAGNGKTFLQSRPDVLTVLLGACIEGY